ncbi:MAG: PilZ domain-containing protein [Nitrospirota bacterium]|jgi:hypothetical protein
MREKRKRRVSIEQDVLINRSQRGTALDLNENGMYVYTRANVVPQSVIELSFALDGEEIAVTAKVEHAQPGIGFGASFVNPEEGVARRIKAFVEELRGRR